MGVSRVHFRAALVHGDATVAGGACSLTSPEDVDPMAWAILATKCKTFSLADASCSAILAWETRQDAGWLMQELAWALNPRSPALPDACIMVQPQAATLCGVVVTRPHRIAMCCLFPQNRNVFLLGTTLGFLNQLGLNLIPTLTLSAA